eukprot:m.206604 g.206604  ORF g.206604 m.206604 type:complete len:663 (-) comp32958_c0_seq2:95-2083(-)
MADRTTRRISPVPPCASSTANCTTPPNRTANRSDSYLRAILIEDASVAHHKSPSTAVDAHLSMRRRVYPTIPHHVDTLGIIAQTNNLNVLSVSHTEQIMPVSTTTTTIHTTTTTTTITTAQQLSSQPHQIATLPPLKGLAPPLQPLPPLQPSHQQHSPQHAKVLSGPVTVIPSSSNPTSTHLLPPSSSSPTLTLTSKSFPILYRTKPCQLEIYPTYFTIVPTKRGVPQHPQHHGPHHGHLFEIRFDHVVAIEQKPLPKSIRKRKRHRKHSTSQDWSDCEAFTIHAGNGLPDKVKPPYNRLELLAIEFHVQSPLAKDLGDTLDEFTCEIFASRPKRLRTYVNPVSGNRKGLKTLAKLVPLFELANVELSVVKTQHGKHAEELAQTDDLEEYDGVLLISGDGMVNEVMNGIMSREDKYRPPIGLIPCGSTNTICYTVIGNDDYITCALRIIFGSESNMDLGKLDRDDQPPSYFAFLSHGFFGDVMRHSESLRTFGSMRYTISGTLMLLRGRSYNIAIKCATADGPKVFQGRYKTILVSAIQNRHAKSVYGVAPDSKLDDGVMTVILVKRCNWFRFLIFMMRISGSGTHLSLPYVEHVVCTDASIFPSPKQKHSLTSQRKSKTGVEPEFHRNSWNIDGELIDDPSVSLTMCKEAMRVFSPARPFK